MSAYKTCPDCGERVYNLGCVNCNEPAYIEEQEQLTALQYPDVLCVTFGREEFDPAAGHDDKHTFQPPRPRLGV